MIDFVKTMLLGLSIVIPFFIAVFLLAFLMVTWPFYVAIAFVVILFLMACYNIGSTLKEKK